MIDVCSTTATMLIVIVLLFAINVVNADRAHAANQILIDLKIPASPEQVNYFDFCTYVLIKVILCDIHIL
jgi:hypothetical protein